MNETIVILGNGFDRDLGIDLSFNAYYLLDELN